MLYFAYGSNMDWERITKPGRAPSAQFLLRATLPDHVVKFNRHSVNQKTGTADVIQQPGSLVWGALFHVEDTDGGKLDDAEGVKWGSYRPETVTGYAENDKSRPLLVRTYVVCEKKEEHQAPAQWYLDHIVNGANKWGLPKPYIKFLQSFETLEDREAAAAKNLAREIANRTIRNNRHLWEELKYRLDDCQHVDVYGSEIQMGFLSAVRHEVTKLSEAEQTLLQKCIQPEQGSPSHATYHDIINGQIFSRAKGVVRRT